MTLAAPQDAAESVCLPAADIGWAAAPPSIWLSTRDARQLDLFRVLAGTLLSLHFMHSALELVPLLSAGLLDPAFAASAVSDLGRDALCGLIASRALLSLCIALGFAPRRSALLLVLLGVVLSGPLWRLQHLDDWTANVTGLWLALLPVGRTLRVGARTPRDGGTRVSGIVVCLFAAHVLALYPNVPFWIAHSPLWTPQRFVVLAACAVPALYLLPSLPMRRLAAALQVALHGYLLVVSGEPLTHAMLLASAVLLWGGRPHGKAWRPATPRVDLSVVSAVAYTALLSLWILSGRFGAIELRQVTGRILADLGVHAPVLAARVDDTQLSFVSASGQQRPWDQVPGLPALDGLAARLLVTQVVASARSGAGGDGQLALVELDIVARIYCEKRIPSERPVTVVVSSPASGSAAQPVATFHCQDAAHSLRLLSTPEASNPAQPAIRNVRDGSEDP